MTDYSIEDLHRIFLNHTSESEKSREEHLSEFRELNPNEPIPKHLTNDFNLPKALAVICEEIVKMKNTTAGL